MDSICFSVFRGKRYVGEICDFKNEYRMAKEEMAGRGEKRYITKKWKETINKAQRLHTFMSI